MKPIRILIVDDHPVVVEGMYNLLSTMQGMQVVGKTFRAVEAFSFLQTNEVDVLITDINLPEINGIELCRKVVADFPNIKVIAMSTYSDKSFVSEMISQGAKAYLTKDAGPEEIELAIHAALKNQLTVNISQNTNSLKSGEAPVITRREKEVLVLIAEGLTNKEIADKLFVSQSTVDSHRKNLLAKFEALNTAALVAHAARVGLL